MLAMKRRPSANPFIDQHPNSKQTLVDMKGNSRSHLLTLFFTYTCPFTDRPPPPPPQMWPFSTRSSNKQLDDRVNRAPNEVKHFSCSFLLLLLLFSCSPCCNTRFLSPSSVSVYYFSPEKDESIEEGKLTVRDKIMSGCLKLVDILCVWDCCWCWNRIQEIFALIVFDPFMELFITLCIIVNTFFMALDHHDMDPDFERILKAGNYVCSLSFFFFLCSRA